MLRRCYLVFITLAVTGHVLLQAGDSVTSSSRRWPYLHIYPRVNDTDARTPLYFALVLSFGGDYTSIGALPGIQVALDYINNDLSLLPGYTLHYTLTDSKCNNSMAFDAFFKEINFPPTKVGWVGSGCSVATEPTAHLTQHYNITQLSCATSSPELKNRERFRYYFQLAATDVLIAQGFIGIIENYGWKRVGIISQDENLFTASVDSLRESLNDIEYIEKRFRSDEGIRNINEELFDPGTRIYLLAMYSPHARDVLCKAYREGILYPKYMFITYGWYDAGWWKASNGSFYNCTGEEIAKVLRYTLISVIQENPVDPGFIADPGFNVMEFISQYYYAADQEINDDINLQKFIESTPFAYSYHCHEAVLTFAYALNQTITDLSENSTLNMEAAKLSDLPDGENFTMADFTYANSAVVSRMFAHLVNTSFPGISGNQVSFDRDGTRDLNTVAILQYQTDPQRVNELKRTEVGVVTYLQGSRTVNSSDFNLILPDGIPNDGIPIEEIVTVSVALTAVYVLLAIAGFTFTALCLIFTLVFRRKKLIRLSSPNLNYIIVLGAIILYLNVITFVIPTTDPDSVSVLCNINPWLTSLGYSLCYGTILIKMIRVWVIFSKPLGLKAPLIQDYVMALFVLCLVVIDVVTLGIYTLTEGLRGNLGVKLTPNRELPKETLGPTAEIHQYFLYVCEANGQVVLYAVLYGYKGLLQAIALILAFRTRKVKVKGLDDSKYIAASIYVTSIVLAVIIVSTYTLMDYVNVYPAVVGMGLLIGTTMILGLVFVPRMVGLYKDPEGEKISFMSSVVERSIGGGNEVKALRQRVAELEHNLRKRSSSTDGQLPEITGDPRCSVVDDTDQYRPQHEQIAVSNGTEERACRQSNV